MSRLPRALPIVFLALLPAACTGPTEAPPTASPATAAAGVLSAVDAGPGLALGTTPSAGPTEEAPAPTAPARSSPPAPATGETVVADLTAEAGGCIATPRDVLGPFYVPGAPERDAVGRGHVMVGFVREAGTCAPIPGALVEIWLAGPDGAYGDDYRASLFAGGDGAYRFASHRPPPYEDRPPHLHFRVTAEGYRELVTQYYPAPGKAQATFDLVLEAR